MSDYFNVNVPPVNQDACGNISWARVKFGATGNSLRDLKMCGPIDMDGFPILNSGGVIPDPNPIFECVTLTDTPGNGAKVCADGYTGLRTYQIDESDFLNVRIPVIEGTKAISVNASKLPSLQTDWSTVANPSVFSFGSGANYVNSSLIITRIDNIYDNSYTVTADWTTGAGNVIAFSLPLPGFNPIIQNGTVLFANVSFAPTIASDPQLLTFSLIKPSSTDLSLTLSGPLIARNYKLVVTYKAPSQ